MTLAPSLEKRGVETDALLSSTCPGHWAVPGRQRPLWRPLGSIPGLPAAMWCSGSLAVCGGGGQVGWWSELVPCFSAQLNHLRLAPPTCPTAPLSRLPWSLPLYWWFHSQPHPAWGLKPRHHPRGGLGCPSRRVCRPGPAASGAAVSRLPACELPQCLERG